jgi:ADP-ribosylglycohydrolase
VSAFTKDRVVGCIVGGAIGDALGGIAERRQISLSDDTQLTLATCEALTVDRRSAAAVADAMLRWFRERRITGIGSATLKAMRDLDIGAHWALSGARGEMAAGNGAAMRIAPLAFILDPADRSARTFVRDVARITHHSDEAYVGALAVLVAIHQLRHGSTIELPAIAEHLPDSRVRDRLLEIAAASDDSLSRLAIRFGASGYVVDTVPLALVAAARMTPATMEDTLYELNETGGDSDTIGAIAGQVAGTSMGFALLPRHLVAALPAEPPVLRIAEEFALVAAG